MIHKWVLDTGLRQFSVDIGSNASSATLKMMYDVNSHVIRIECDQKCTHHNMLILLGLCVMRAAYNDSVFFVVDGCIPRWIQLLAMNISLVTKIPNALFTHD